MNFVDILIWAVLLLFVVKGFMKGLVKEACSLIGLLAGGWAACKYHHFLAEAVRTLIHLPQYFAEILSFILIFAVIGALFYLLGHLLTVVCKIMLLGWVNRIGGVIFGLLEGAFILCLVLYFGSMLPAPERVKRWMTGSKSARVLTVTGREIVSGWEVMTGRGKTPGKAG